MNEVWLVWSVLQLPLILRELPFRIRCSVANLCGLLVPDQADSHLPVIDNLELYPERLWKPAGSPLHFAYGAKKDYIAEFNDPIPQWSAATASGHDSWMGLFCHLEVIFVLPIVLFTIFRLGIQRRGTSGAHELLMLVYAFEAAFTTLTCMNDVLYWESAVYPAALKQKLLTNMYAPFLVIRKWSSFPCALQTVADCQSFHPLRRHGLPHPRTLQGSRCLAGWEEDAVDGGTDRMLACVDHGYGETVRSQNNTLAFITLGRMDLSMPAPTPGIPGPK